MVARPTGPEAIARTVGLAAVDPNTGDSRGYLGSTGIHALLRLLHDTDTWHAIRADDDLVGLDRDDGTRITLGPAGAVGYRSAPAADVAALLATTDRDLRQLAESAAELGIALVPGATYPFSDLRRVTWVPDRRHEIVRGHLAGLGTDGGWGPEVMALTLPNEVTFDHTDAEDLRRKLHAMVAAAPVVAALLVNSPLTEGRWNGLLSQRMRYRTRCDPARSGVLEVGLRDDVTAADFVEWAIGLPMIYRADRHGHVRPAPAQPFARVLADGFPDGSVPTWRDWRTHLAQIWTDVRIRDRLAQDAVDGPPFPLLGTVPAIWVGLLYDRASCQAVWDLLGDHTAADHRKLLDDVALRGMRAQSRGRPVTELADELLWLAQRGLSARVKRGLERRDVLTLLDPLLEVVQTGTTFAERCLDRWHGELRESPQRYVRAYRIPVD